ncbi:MAG: hypothetical protein MR350_07335 [Alphaproteobacteria bacterium]|nr:hypothetical protein [Alphaproteobacteria bacterium]
MSRSIRKIPILPMSPQQIYEMEQRAVEYLKWAQKQNWDGVASAFVDGAKQGAIVGLESALSGRTLGGYEWLDKKFDLGRERRLQEMQQLAESANAGTAFKIANMTAEVGGGMKGIAEKTWNLGAKAAQLAPVIKNSKVIAPAIGGAGLSSLVENSFKYDFSDLKKIGLGSLEGTAAAVALIALQNGAFDVIKKFFPEANLAGLRGGIDNVLQNEKAMATVQKGMEVNSDLAQTVAKQTPAAAQRINQNTENIVNQALKQHIDVPQTVANRQEQFNNYLQQHSADEVLDATPVVSRYTAGDGIQTLKSIRKNMQKQEPDFKMAIDKNGNIDYQHFTQDHQRAEYLRTLPETYKNPDKIVFAKNNNDLPREYRMKEYYNPNNKQRVYDIDIKSDDGTLITKFAREGNSGKKYYNNIEDMRLTSQASETARGPGQTWTAHIPDSPRIIYITPQKNVVNPNLPHISELYKNLPYNQQKMLHEAFNRALQQNSAKAGSLGNLQSAVNELDKMIEIQSKNGVNPAEITDLLNIKNYLSQHLGGMYEQEAQKLAKAKQLENVYQAGQQSAPLPQSASKIEQAAYAQGQFENMAANSTNQNLAQQVLQEPNINNRLSQETNLWLQNQEAAYQRNQTLQQQAQRYMFNEQKPRNYIEQIKYYLETDAGRKALDPNFDGTNKRYSRQPKPYFLNSAVQTYERNTDLDNSDMTKK